MRLGAGAWILCWLAGCAHGPARPLPPGDAQRPDVILISIDTLRADHLGIYGHGHPTSPFLDERAREGTVFEQAWSPAPWTLPAHASMLSARRPAEHGAIDQERAISPDVPLLAETLATAGYRTAAVVSAPFVGARYGFDRGFDAFVDLSDTKGEFDLDSVADAEEVLDRGLRWIENEPPARPAFLFLHLYDVHYPYDPPPPWNTRFGPAAPKETLHYENYFYYLQHPLAKQRLERLHEQYDEEIAYVDDRLRAFWQTWMASRPNTIFVVVSDHGEELGERGSWGHAHTLTPEQLHVPWIVFGRGIARGRVDRRVGLEDLAPTLAALAGTRFGPFDGVSRAAWLRGQGGELLPGGGFASTSRRNTLRLRWHFGPEQDRPEDLDLIVDLRAHTARLYDLASDPRAVHDLSTERPELLRQTWARAVADTSAAWRVRRRGTFETDGVMILDDGQLVSPRVTLAAGRRFALWPADAVLRFSDEVHGAGPWARVGGALPADDDPVAFLGARLRSRTVEIDEAAQERLRSLGYVH